jgi:hypothetical protein
VIDYRLRFRRVTGVTVVGVGGHLVAEPSAEDSATLQALMNAGHADLVEFLGWRQ